MRIPVRDFEGWGNNCRLKEVGQARAESLLRDSNPTADQVESFWRGFREGTHPDVVCVC